MRLALTHSKSGYEAYFFNEMVSVCKREYIGQNSCDYGQMSTKTSRNPLENTGFSRVSSSMKD